MPQAKKVGRSPRPPGQLELANLRGGWSGLELTDTEGTHQFNFKGGYGIFVEREHFSEVL